MNEREDVDRRRDLRPQDGWAKGLEVPEGASRVSSGSKRSSKDAWLVGSRA